MKRTDKTLQSMFVGVGGGSVVLANGKTRMTKSRFVPREENLVPIRQIGWSALLSTVSTAHT